MIDLAGVRVVYGRTIALDDVTLSIGEGVTGVYGPNGSGKSTLLRVISGLFRPASGDVSFDGVPRHPADESLRRRIGYAGHEAGLYPRLTVRENLSLFAALWGAPAASVGLGPRADARVGELSSGLKRRASVARALVHQPSILLLDKPFAGLDDDAADLVTDAIKQWRAPGRTAIIATHGAKRLKSFADAGIVLRRGRVASDHARTAAGIVR
ncbi:MAG TPA: ABC transporter ATP-binding protein [Actinomycetota bacterium]|nr:ABC transporter ATP-binding protein [Actinomycetota bacterium]